MKGRPTKGGGNPVGFFLQFPTAVDERVTLTVEIVERDVIALTMHYTRPFGSVSPGAWVLSHVSCPASSFTQLARITRKLSAAVGPIPLDAYGLLARLDRAGICQLVCVRGAYSRLSALTSPDKPAHWREALTWGTNRNLNQETVR